MKKYDVYAIGNAVVDYEIKVDDAFLQEHKVEKGLMTLVDEPRQKELLEAVDNRLAKKQGGGSAANSIVGLSQFGGTGFYTCKVANDEDGHFFIQGLHSLGVDTNLDDAQLESGITGKCLVMVSPNGERTMNTFLGITSDISTQEIKEEALSQSEYLFLEGYLISSDTGREAMKQGKALAEKLGVKTSITFSDPAMVKYFGEPMKEVVGDGVDLLFCNEEEACLFTGKEKLEEALEELKTVAGCYAVTKGGDGSVIWDGKELKSIPTTTIDPVDTTGAGDIFSGAFLYALTQGYTYEEAAKLANRAATKVVSQFGPRLEKEEVLELLTTPAVKE